MPRGGSNAKPTPIRKLQGTLRPDRTRNEPKSEPLSDTRPPAGLDAYGRVCWRRNLPKLQRMNVLDEADADMFTAYCDAYSQWRTAIDDLRRLAKVDAARLEDDEKEDLPKTWRGVQINREKARDQMRMLAAEFGMTPGSRSRLSLGKGKDAPADDMEMLLSGRRTG